MAVATIRVVSVGFGFIWKVVSTECPERLDARGGRKTRLRGLWPEQLKDEAVFNWYRGDCKSQRLGRG